ncbi:MAG: EAL domain-containing protein [Wenzhouxiangella sp.]
MAANRAALQRTLEIRERLLAELRVGVYELIDAPGGQRHIGFLSERSLELLGVSREEVEADFHAAFRRAHPDDVTRIIESNDQAWREATPFQVTMRVSTDDGLRWLRIQSWPRQAADGVHWAGSITDVTEQKEAEEKFRVIFEQAPLSIILNDAATLEIMDANEAAWRSYGLDSVDQMRIAELFDAPPYAMADFMPAIERARAGEVQRLRWRSRDRTGRLFWEDVVIVPVQIGGRSCLFSISIDMTEQVQAECELAEREELLSAMSRLSETGGWSIYPETGDIRWTEQTFRIHDLPVTAEPPLTHALSFFNADDRARLEQAIEAAHQHAQPYDLTLSMRTAAGRDVLVRTLCKPVVHDGRVVRLVGAFQDVTELTRNQQALVEAEARFRSIFEQAPLSLMLHDADSGEILDSNPTAWMAHGAASLAELKARAHAIWAAPPYHQEAALARIQRARYQGRQQFDWKSRRLDGTMFWEQVTLTPLRVAGRECVLSASIDITLRRESQRLLKESDERFRTLLKEVPGVAIQGFGLDGKLNYWNQASEALYGYTEQEALGADLLELIIPPNLRAQTRAGIDQVALGGTIENAELERMRKDGSRVLVYASHAVVRRRGLPIELFSIDIDLSERKRHEDELLRIASYDALTGLPNRNLLAELMREQCARADRGGEGFALCYLDLDQFKPINDQFGHAVGDLVLVEIAQRLRQSVRASDVVCRLGGDEFVLLLSGLSEGKDLERRLDALLSRLAEPMRFDHLSLQVEASIGVTMYPEDSSDPDILLRHADQAMYRAKAQGRNGFRLFDLELESELQRRRERLEGIAAAMRDGQFLLYFHPKISLCEGAVRGVEGLVRWQHPEQGLLAPGQFLADLAQSELEYSFGEMVIELALQQLECWLAQGLDLRVSVNISGPHLLAPDFLAKLTAALQRHATAPPCLFQLEILETAAVADLDQAIDVLQGVRNLGVTVSLDDFGTGYSSLSHLRSLPVDEVKIDQSFVRNMLNDAGDYNIVRSVIGLARAFSLRVVAEGVESMAHSRALMELKCGLAQGYAFARPMPAAELPGWLEQWREQAAGMRWGTSVSTPQPENRSVF